MQSKLYFFTAIILLLLPALFSSSIYFALAQSDLQFEPEVDNNLKAGKIPAKTDDEIIQREEQAISNDGYSVEELKLIRSSAEKHQFQAEVNRVMSIIINSLYSNKDIFLRELISNASDALDKVRFLSLTDKAQLGNGDASRLEIKVKADPQAKTITFTDSGIGMTKEDLISKLGTIAKSGTREFMERVKDAENNLIGQFGVGFYSAFLVADTVTVTSKHPSDPRQWIWESDSQSTFSISEDPRGDTLGRGTKITLALKEDALDYLKEDVLKGLIKKYSEFINFPIYLWTEESIVEEEKVAEDETEGVEIKDGEEAKQETAPEKKTVFQWTLQNTNKPIWTRSPSDISDEEYNNFYKAISNDLENPIEHTHFFGEGEIEFKSILYIPSKPSGNVFEVEKQKENRGLRLYVKRVFITDDFSDMFPRYLSFIKGVVDSDNLPLNVSREILQQDRTLSLIKKKLIRKAIAMFQTLSENKEKYLEFWEKYGSHVKLGVAEDTNNRARLSKLLRYHSSKTEELTSFDDYLSRMKEGQTQIYYLAGDSLESVASSPLLEGLKKKGYEVLFMTDTIDEWAMQSLVKYENKYPLLNVAKEGLKLDGEEDGKEEDKSVDEEFKPLVNYLKETLQGKVAKVSVSHQLVDTPSVILSGAYGFTANMERIMKAQAFSDKKQFAHMKSQRVLEINPRHPIVRELLRRIEAGDVGDRKVLEDLALVLYETASVSSGFDLDDPTLFAERIHRMMKLSLRLDDKDDVSVPVVEDININDEVASTTHNEDEL